MELTSDAENVLTASEDLTLWTFYTQFCTVLYCGFGCSVEGSTYRYSLGLDFEGLRRRRYVSA